MKCAECGKEIEKSSYSHEILCSRACFIQDYWKGIMKDLTGGHRKDRTAIIKGEVYYLDPNETNYGFKGYGGRTFKIKFFDGRVMISNNLWHNGTIPENFRDKLPDNAEFDWDGVE